MIVFALLVLASNVLASLSNTRKAADDPVDRSRVDKAFARGLKLLRKNDVDAGTIDYSSLVNPFIGTGATYNPGNVFPGASIPFGMAKFGIDVDEYAPAGYNDDIEAEVRGMSLIHDTGTGSSSGSYGNFESMPVICSHDDYVNCPTSLDDRKRQRIAQRDYATPGYFTTTLNNTITLETTTTRRAGLLRYTFPKRALNEQHAEQPFVVFDWTNDLPGTFRGGEMHIDPTLGRITMNGSYASSFGSSLFTYQAFACYDLLAVGRQEIDFYGIFQADRFGQDFKAANATFSTQPRSQYGGQPPQRGALISWKRATETDNEKQILIRAGVSYVSAERACQNAEQEVLTFDFDAVRNASRAAWNDKLARLRIANDSEETIAQLIYTSFYRSFLSPNNATEEGQGVFANTQSPYFDGLYCTWDTFRTFFPFLSLTSPTEYAQIVETYIDGWRKQGFIPECRANNVPGFTQGGSDGTNVLADFAVKYRNALQGVNVNELYDALYYDATTDAIDWSSGGRQIGLYEQYGYIPFGVWNLHSVGPSTREGSRTLEYAFNDFAVRNVAIMLGKTEDAERWTKRASYYKNVFDRGTKSFGFRTFVQRRYANGTFGDLDPTVCSPIDRKTDRSCSLQLENVWSVYETSSFEYSFFVPHDLHGAIELISNGSRARFIRRLDTFFDRGLYYSGNEPSFQTPMAYTYADAPTRSVDRVRRIVYSDFNTTNAGLPGNDDNGAMATLLLFHLLGLYPVPSTREYIVGSPFVSAYTLHNTAFGSVTITAKHFDRSTLDANVPHDARAYVKRITINGVLQSSRCKISFDDLFPSAAAPSSANNLQHTEIVLEMAAKDEIDGCGASQADLPSSMSTGGFDRF